jgi:DNA integrity scanning protein DisA with diadenylate cyclase activity
MSIREQVKTAALLGTGAALQLDGSALDNPLGARHRSAHWTRLL